MFEPRDEAPPPGTVEGGFVVAPGDVLYRPLRKGDAFLLRAGTVLTADLIRKIEDVGLIEEARRAITKPVREPESAPVEVRDRPSNPNTSIRIREAFSGFQAILWLSMCATVGYSVLNGFRDVVYTYASIGLFAASVVTYLASIQICKYQARQKQVQSSWRRAAGTSQHPQDQ